MKQYSRIADRIFGAALFLTAFAYTLWIVPRIAFFWPLWTGPFAYKFLLLLGFVPFLIPYLVLTVMIFIVIRQLIEANVPNWASIGLLACINVAMWFSLGLFLKPEQATIYSFKHGVTNLIGGLDYWNFGTIYRDGISFYFLHDDTIPWITFIPASLATIAHWLWSKKRKYTAQPARAVLSMRLRIVLAAIVFMEFGSLLFVVRGERDVWKDTDSGLTWQVRSTTTRQSMIDARSQLNWIDANNYCENLNFGAQSDWRLPTISELRSLIRRCSAMMTGGSCGVTDSCLSKESCWNEYCGLHGEHLYWYSACIDGGRGFYGGVYPSEPFNFGSYQWSSSTVPDLDNRAWALSLWGGNISEFDRDRKDIMTVRCVR
jgi:uncharacterized protein (TIGR02145 family)